MKLRRYDTARQHVLRREANQILGVGKPWISKRKKKKHKRTKVRRLEAFFYTTEWKEIRYKALKRDGGKCQLCGRSAHDGNVMNVDHIKPRRKYPHLALDLNNLQTLCASCNWGKGGIDESDWRVSRELDAEYRAIMQEDIPNPTEQESR